MLEVRDVSVSPRRP